MGKDSNTMSKMFRMTEAELAAIKQKNAKLGANFKPSKYKNQKTNGFDSKRESKRYDQLRAMQAVGEISELQTQVKYVLIPSQRRSDGVAERPVTYIADFTYWRDHEFVVEDAKGFKTPDYVIKRKLLLKVHGITVMEV